MVKFGRCSGGRAARIRRAGVRVKRITRSRGNELPAASLAGMQVETGVVVTCHLAIARLDAAIPAKVPRISTAHETIALGPERRRPIHPWRAADVATASRTFHLYVPLHAGIS